MNGTAATNMEMNVALWIVSIAMGLEFAAAGAMKLVLSKKRLERGAGWIEDFSSGTVRFVGLTEVMGGAAIILPAVMHIPPRLVLPAGLGPAGFSDRSALGPTKLPGPGSVASSADR